MKHREKGIKEMEIRIELKLSDDNEVVTEYWISYNSESSNIFETRDTIESQIKTSANQIANIFAMALFERSKR